ncbi:MAG: hypothetical protein HXS48_03115 [Theionarchaea archaeon]|nr:hypothetical protein [Theionarchaea archaeon]
MSLNRTARVWTGMNKSTSGQVYQWSCRRGVIMLNKNRKVSHQDDNRQVMHPGGGTHSQLERKEVSKWVRLLRL